MRILDYCRTSAVTSLVAATVMTVSSGVAGAADPTGDWRVAEGVANIRVAECNGSMWGVVAWEKKPGGVDQNNPDASKKSRPTLGMPILLDMKKKADKDAWEGQVYNAKDGKTYESTIKLASPDQLEIEGCVLGFLCGGETWTRVGPPISSSASNGPGATASKTGTARTAQSKPHKTSSKNKAATTGTASDDPVGDICLLPDIAGATH